MEEIVAEGRLQLVDVSMESISHVNWADEDPDQISFIWVTEEGVQVKLLRKTSRMTVGEGPPSWIKWHVGGQ